MRRLNDVLENSLIIECNTKKDAKDFLKILHENGVRWQNHRDDLLETTFWEEGKIYYRVDSFKKLSYGGRKCFQNHNYEIVKFQELNKEDKMNNKMTEVAKILGKELEEEFMIEGKSAKYMLTEKGLLYRSLGGWNLSVIDMLQSLLTGKLKIKWTPKQGEKIWEVLPWAKSPIEIKFYSDSYHHKLLFERGFIFKTEQEAIQNMKDRGWII